MTGLLICVDHAPEKDQFSPRKGHEHAAARLPAMTTRVYAHLTDWREIKMGMTDNEWTERFGGQSSLQDAPRPMIHAGGQQFYNLLQNKTL